MNFGTTRALVNAVKKLEGFRRLFCRGEESRTHGRSLYGFVALIALAVHLEQPSRTTNELSTAVGVTANSAKIRRPE